MKPASKLPLSLPAAILGLLFLSSGCTPPEEDKAKGPPLDERIASLKELKEEAEKAGAADFAKENFDTFAKKLEDAEELLPKSDEKSQKKARSLVSAAERGFKDLVKQGEETKGAREKAQKSKTVAEKAIADLKTKKIDESAPEGFGKIQDLMEQAQKDLAAGVPSKIEAAKRAFEKVPEMALAARREAKENSALKADCDEQRKFALEKQGKALEAKADKLVAESYTRISQSLRDAEKAYKKGSWQEALDGFKSAETSFAELISQAGSANPVENQPPPDPSNLTDPAAGGEKGGTKEAPPLVATPDPAPAAPETPGAEAGNVAPGELSPEDEIYLAENLQKLYSKITPVYDQSTGIISCEYSFGDELKKDMLLSGTPENHILYKDPMGGLNKKAAGGNKELGLVFQGNTGGFFLLPIPLKESITADFYVEIALMKSEGELTFIMGASKDGKSYLGANFGTVEVWKDGSRKFARQPPDKKYQGSPNMWFLKIRIGMRVKYEVFEDPKDKKQKAKCSIWYNTDEESDDPINSVLVPVRSGLVGFSWFVSKFNIRQLKITGKLDKQAAIKMIREKLGEKPSAEGAAPAGGGGKGGTKSVKDTKPAGGNKGADPSSLLDPGAPAPKNKKADKKKGSDAEKDDY